MSRRLRLALKLGVHLVCLAPLLWVTWFSISPRVILNPNPVQFVIDFTGKWAAWLLLVSISVSILGKLTAKHFWPIQVYRIIDIYALFYATLHVAIYFFIYSGYDFFAAFAEFHTGHPAALVTEWNAVLPLLSEDFRKRGFLGFGLLAWALLIVGSVASQGLVQVALRGKKWRYLSRFIYLAMLATAIHLWSFAVSLW